MSEAGSIISYIFNPLFPPLFPMSKNLFQHTKTDNYRSHIGFPRIFVVSVRKIKKYVKVCNNIVIGVKLGRRLKTLHNKYLWNYQIFIKIHVLKKD